MNIDFIREEVAKAANKASLKNCRIVVFGLRASSTNTVGSDLYLGLWYHSHPATGVLTAFQEALEESRIPCHVDLVILNKARPEFVESVLKDSVTVYEDTVMQQ